MVVDVLVATCMSNLLRFLASINVSGLVGNTMRLVLLAIVVFFLLLVWWILYVSKIFHMQHQKESIQNPFLLKICRLLAIKAATFSYF